VKAAGAQSIIMSLWKVPDEQTKELMTAFYTNWLSGMSKREAFTRAQDEVRQRHPHPYYWGAFVLVGE
jgi:CHAT domain-containing protein